MKVAAILNASAGSMTGAAGVARLDAVNRAFLSHGVNAAVASVSRDRLPHALSDAARSKADVLVVGGGDGTLNEGARVAIAHSRTFGVLPLGTRNHFARDAGIPTKIEEAVATIVAGHTMQVDVGEVNGRIFLNNSSIGLYPQAVAERDELRHRHGGGKAAAMWTACIQVLRRFPLLDATLEAAGETTRVRTPFVFVGNNRYDMNLLTLGQRATLRKGELGVYLTRNTNRLGVLRLAFRALVGRMRQDRDFQYFTTPEIEIRTRKRSVRVSLDGEVADMQSPIRYSMRPGALRLLVPQDASSAAETP
jgi:YegS/Rv2252/BmrU family lipid kinase